MGIKVIEGDLLQAKEDIIGHQVNCSGQIRSGVAGQIVKQFPDARDKFLELYEVVDDPSTLLGRMQIVWVQEKDKYIANLYGQRTYGSERWIRYTSYDAIYEALAALAQYSDENGLSVALPYKLGSDRGGADWRIVLKMIETLFVGQEITLYKKGENA